MSGLRGAWPLILILLAAGAVIAVAVLTTPAYNDSRAQAALMARLSNHHPPQPGGEAAIRSFMAQISQGQPDYSRLAPRLADAVRKQLPQARHLLAGMGPLRALTYVGGNGRFDTYRATYASSAWLWTISLNKTGTIDGLGFRTAGINSPAQWIDNYKSFDWSAGTTRLAEQFGILFGVFLVGRVIRLRL